MKNLSSWGKLLRCALLTAWAGTGVLPLHAQGPTVDAGFACRSASIGCITNQALQQTSGKQVLLGDFQRVGNGLNRRLVRLLPGSNQPDLTFNANVAGLSVADISYLIGLPNDELLVVSSFNTMRAGTFSQNGPIRLTASGAPDLGFDTGDGTGLGYGLYAVAVQPDGKLLLAGNFPQFNRQPCNKLVRVNANGSRDATFQPVFSAPADYRYKLALQADGKIIVAGSTLNAQQLFETTLDRLLPNGALDTSFAPPPMLPGMGVGGLALQPDGKVLVYVTYQNPLGRPEGLIRLLPTGRLDSTFQIGSGFGTGLNGILLQQPVVVEPGGTILVGHNATTFNGQPVEQLVRLQPDGSLDPNFRPAFVQRSEEYRGPTSLQLLANGQILTNHHLFNANGTTDNRFDPPLRDPGTVLALAQQSDGKLVVGGVFSEIGGAPAGGIARLNRDGTVDTAFTNAAATNAVVQALLVQPNGTVLVGGNFTTLAGSAHTALGQLQASGQPDGNFVPTIVPGQLYQNRFSVRALAVQADGKVLAGGNFSIPSTFGNLINVSLARLLPSGSLDLLYSDLDSYEIRQLLVQPDAKIIVLGQGQVRNVQPYISATVQRLLPNGQSDPAFVPVAGPSFGYQDVAYGGVLDAAGRLYIAGAFALTGSGPRANVVRILSNGSPDPNFLAATGVGGYATSVVVQPNGRLLIGGSFSNGAIRSGSLRLHPNGTQDASYTPSNGPNALVTQVLVQPDGAIVMGGNFTTVNGLARTALVRLLDPNVLSMGREETSPAATQAWPVPAHDVLHLALEAAHRPRRVQLLDPLGRTVRTHPITQPSLDLDTRALPPGLYLLRVEYADGFVTRRIAVE